VTIIPVPRPSKKAMNPDRPVSGLLLAQVQHLQHAEGRLPLRYRSAIYTHAIRTEREAARYIREVTEAIHQAHADAVAERAKGARVRKPRRRAAAQRSREGRSTATTKSPNRAKGE
jgi:hypothetical protein